MSEEETQTAESNKEENLRNLREQKEALEAQLAELTPLKVAQIVKEAGYDPDTPAGKALSRLATVDSDTEAVKNLAEELGFEAEGQTAAPTQTPEEQAFQASANKQAELQSVTTSDEPSDIDSQIADLEASLREARAAQKWDDVKVIGNQLSQLQIAKLRASVATHV